MSRPTGEPALDELILSSDSHVIEPPDLWLERLPRSLRDRAPRVVSEPDGDYWIVDGHRSNSFAGGVQAGQRFEDATELRSAARFAEVIPGAFQPDQHLVDNLADGVWGSVLYPTQGLLLFGVDDLAFLHQLCRAYNDWIAEFCSHDSSRLKGVAMIPLDDIDWAVTELERVVDRGLAGVMIPVAPAPGDPYGQPHQEAFWSAASGAGVPVSLHIGTNRAGLARPGEFRVVSPTAIANADIWVRTSLADLIFAGVFERHPDLRVGTVEHELGWIPFFLDRLDYTYSQRAHRPGWHRFASDARPSDFFRGQVFASFQEDVVGLHQHEIIGTEGLMFGSDYPHTESTYPFSRRIVADLVADLDDRLAADVIRDNCARLYGFEVSEVSGRSGGRLGGTNDEEDD